MFRKTLIALAALGAATSASAQQAGPTPGPKSGEQATIPFLTRSDVRTFTSTDNGEGVYIEDARRNWYYVAFFSRCNELPWAVGIGFKTFAGSSQLDRGDTIFAGRDRCTIASIVHSGPPPEKPKKAKKPKGA
ncbi:DUF6491 family protein [Sphingomonas sp. KR3-1]|uniref:DUF6491 family protein n=1 Tax=Sphingomonas sp. KR3-1 TaxID=3156611 RepID=UPI0032B367B8